MTSSAPRPSRRIASNLLWTPQGLVRHPLLTLGADGRVLSAESCPDPDRLAATEFYAGLLVPDFPADYRAAFDGMRAAALPLSELLPRIVTPGGALVVISGLDYDSLRLTPQSQIRKLWFGWANRAGGRGSGGRRSDFSTSGVISVNAPRPCAAGARDRGGCRFRS